MTHPFHPRRGDTLVLVTRRQNWGEDRVMYFNEAGRLRSMPASWTSAFEADHFLMASGGRSWFRVDDLLELVVLLQSLVTVREPVRRGVK